MNDHFYVSRYYQLGGAVRRTRRWPFVVLLLLAVASLGANVWQYQHRIVLTLSLGDLGSVPTPDPQPEDGPGTGTQL